MTIGLDVDGCFADFNESYIKLVVETSGRDLFPPRPFEIPIWQYPTHYGYTKAEETAVWQVIEASNHFWFDLVGLPGASNALNFFDARRRAGDSIYFITSRPGRTAKEQTEDWLRYFGFPNATVLISSEKGLCARALKLDVYLDDRDVNVANVMTQSPATRTFLLDQPWNRTEIVPPEATRVTSLRAFIAAI